MTSLYDNRDLGGGGGGIGRFIRPLVVIVVLALVAWGVWTLVHDQSGIARKPTPPPLIAIAPPPPPPPPPPKEEKPPEPEKTVPEPPKPQESKAPPPPQNITINGPAQAGGDAFNIGAGSGGGTVASGGAADAGPDFARDSYRQHMRSVLQSLLDRDDRVNRQVFTAELSIWVGPTGRVTRAAIVRSSGDDRVDQNILADFQTRAAFDGPPPASMAFPQTVAVRGRRRG